MVLPLWKAASYNVFAALRPSGYKNNRRLMSCNQKERAMVPLKSKTTKCHSLEFNARECMQSAYFLFA